MVSASGYTKEGLEKMIGETIIGVRVANGERLIIKLQNQQELDVGDVKGVPLANASAASLPVGPIAGVTSTNNNAQLAVADLAGDLAVLNGTTSAGKLNHNQVKKIMSGRVTHQTEYFPPDPNTGRYPQTHQAFANVFPPGYFTETPEVLITPLKSTSPAEITSGFAVNAVTLTGFTITSQAYRYNEVTGIITWLAVPFDWVASANQTFS